MDHAFEPDDSGLTCRLCGFPPRNRRHGATPGVPLTSGAPRARHDAPSTSVQAAVGALPAIGTVRHQIITLVGANSHRGGCTDDELEVQSGRTHQSVSAARNSLVADGWLMDSGDRRTTRGGHDAIVWWLTRPARRAVPGIAPDPRDAD